MAALTDEASHRACLQSLRERFQVPTVVTLGERGLIHDTGRGFEAMPAFPVEAVDTTGAGDVFHGALAYGVARGLARAETLRLASMAAALSVQKAGGRASIPALAEVMERLGGGLT
jgi:sugar/nucleoside kinase (ribokinase family)